jgi:hypothetical protein
VQVSWAASGASGRTVEPGQTVTVIGDRNTFRMHQDFGLWAEWQVTQRLVDGAKKKVGEFVGSRPTLNAVVTCARFCYNTYDADHRAAGGGPHRSPRLRRGLDLRGQGMRERRTGRRHQRAAACTHGRPRHAREPGSRLSEQPGLRQVESAGGRALRTGAQRAGRLLLLR